jgi:hypothetical protein
MSIQHRHNPELYADELAAAEKNMQRRTGLGLPQFILDTMAEQDRIYALRTAAGWEYDEGCWYAPHPVTGEMIPGWDWECEFDPLPEDVK